MSAWRRSMSSTRKTTPHFGTACCSLPEEVAEAVEDVEAAVVAVEAAALEAVALEAVEAVALEAVSLEAGAAEVAVAAAVYHGELAAGARSEHALTRSILNRGSKDSTAERRATKARLTPPGLPFFCYLPVQPPQRQVDQLEGVEQHAIARAGFDDEPH
jgi:hypothetical protein